MPNKLLISDANILIDMEVAGLLEDMFRLEYEFAVPDILFHDELSDHHPNLPNIGLSILEMKAECVQAAFELVDQYGKSGASRYDLSALALAQDKKCPLLSGDRILRKICRQMKQEIHGTLWLMEQMFQSGIIDSKSAESAYEKMKNQQRRLPWKEVGLQINRFER